MHNSITSTTDSKGGINTGPVHCMENHDGALAVWREAGVVRRVLLHVDAHHDLYGRWIGKQDSKERARINIGNFIYAALEEDLVREIIWVVPDQTWATAAGRRDAARELKGLDQGGVRKRSAVRVETDCIIGTVLGKRILACTADNLPVLNEAVLLDIDLDYFIIPNIGYRDIVAYGALPWCWPVDLLARLDARGVRTDLTTIAYSVEGDYTPLQWKYLGDELAQRLRPVPPDMQWADQMRAAALAAGRGDFASAETHYLVASKLRPELAAPRYHLAHLYATTGQLELGCEHLRRACDLAPSYRSPYNSAGWWYLEKHRLEQARAAFARTLSLDPADAYAHLGCGLLAIRQKKWPAAEASLRRALASNDCCVEAYRALGQVLMRRRAYADAAAAYERSLQLALSGHRALTCSITLSAGHEGDSPWDPDHGAILCELARIHAAAGAWAKAITDYRMAIAAGGIDTVDAWLRLALLHARMRQWPECAKAARQAASGMPRRLSRSLRRRWIRSRDAPGAARQATAPAVRANRAASIWI